jgi:hypothetical protein
MPTIYKKFCKTVSLADFLVVAAEAVMGRTATNYSPKDRYGEGTFAHVLK